MDAYRRNGDGDSRVYEPTSTSSSASRGFEPADGMHERPLKSLVTEMLEQGRRLMRAELRLARAELKREAKKAGAGTGLAAAGAGVAVLGAFTFVAFLVLALAQLIPAWGAALLVAVLLLGGGAALGWLGMQRLKQVHAPRRTMETLKEDSRWAKETIRSAQSQMHGHA